MHQQLEAGRGDEDLDLATDDKGVRAVFAAGDELLRYPRVRLRCVNAGGVLFRLGVRRKGEECHVAAVGIVHRDGLQNVLDSLDLCIREDVTQLSAGSDNVGFRNSEAESLGALDEGVFFVQHGRRGDVVLDGFARRLSFDGFLGFAIADCTSDTGTADPEVNVLSLDDAEETGDIAC